MKIGAIIIARNSSTRLPGKVLKKIRGKRILDYIIERLKQAIDIENIIIATSMEKDDDLIEYYCKECKIKCFRGDLHNVSKRFLDASIHYNLDYAIRINGDNLFVDIPTLKTMLHAINYKYDVITNVFKRTFPRGMSIEIIKVSFYSKIYKTFKDEDDYEHVTKYIYKHKEQVNILEIENKICPEAANIQLAIDTYFDFILAERIIGDFEDNHIKYNLIEIYNLYLKHIKTMHFVGRYGPLLIAEIGGNHEGNFEYAKELTKLAIESDSDVIKFQLYTGDTLVNPLIDPSRNKHFKKFELSKVQYLELAEMVQQAGKKFMASVWDLSMIEWIDKYMPIYKIGSGDLLSWSLLEEIAKLNKPIILSTGLATENEVFDTIKFLQKTNNIYKDKNYLSILQCTSMYPIPYSEANLSVISRLKKLSKLTVGYSDHTIGYDALVYSVAMGAQILEFHFTDSRDGKVFRDHQVSLTKNEVHNLIDKIQQINTLSGNPKKEPTLIEKAHNHTKSFRRAIYPSCDIKKGEKLTKNNLTILRPEEGISSRYFYDIVGKKAKNDIKKYEKLNWNMLSD